MAVTHALGKGDKDADSGEVCGNGPIMGQRPRVCCRLQAGTSLPTAMGAQLTARDSAINSKAEKRFA